MDQLIHYADEGPVYFYGGPLSSFASRKIKLPPGCVEQYCNASTQTYPSREHYYQSAKAKTLNDHDWVLTGLGPAYMHRIDQDTWRVKARGQEVDLREDWEEVKYETMLRCIRYEVEHYTRLRDFLLSTGDRLLAEDSPTDFVWGIRDADGGLTGDNLLGKAWMDVRTEIR
jgi:ribA/ribD-fused uncharacterized protein